MSGSQGETRLRMTTEADGSSLRAYRQELDATRASLEALHRAAREYAAFAAGAGGGPGGGGGGGGGPTPPGGGWGAPGGGGGGGGGAPPAPPAPPRSPRRPPEDEVPAWRQRINSGGQFLGNAASTALGIGLGSSISGFILEAGHKYMQLDRVLTHVDRRFREVEMSGMRAGAAVRSVGAAMGYTTAEAGSYAEALGTQTDVIKMPAFRRTLGFARFAGVDPTTAMQTMGQLSHLTHSQITDNQMLAMLGNARHLHMGQGRFGEYLQTTGNMAEEMLHATGGVDLEAVMGAMRMPGYFVGFDDPRAQGAHGQRMMMGLHRGMSGSDASRTFMLRAMGFGKDPNMGYIAAKKRLAAGIFDERNLSDMAAAFRAQGLGKGGIFRALEVMTGGSIDPATMEQMADMLSKPGAETFEIPTAYGSSDVDRATFMQDGMTKEERQAFRTHGFSQPMRGTVSIGEAAGVQMEGMQMEVGRVVAQATVEIRDIGLGLMRILENFTGGNPANIGDAILSTLDRIDSVVDNAARVRFPVRALGWGLGLSAPAPPGQAPLRPAGGGR